MKQDALRLFVIQIEDITNTMTKISEISENEELLLSLYNILEECISDFASFINNLSHYKEYANLISYLFKVKKTCEAVKNKLKENSLLNVDGIRITTICNQLKGFKENIVIELNKHEESIVAKELHFIN